MTSVSYVVIDPRYNRQKFFFFLKQLLYNRLKLFSISIYQCYISVLIADTQQRGTAVPQRHLIDLRCVFDDMILNCKLSPYTRNERHLNVCHHRCGGPLLYREPLFPSWFNETSHKKEKKKIICTGKVDDMISCPQWLNKHMLVYYQLQK